MEPSFADQNCVAEVSRQQLSRCNPKCTDGCLGDGVLCACDCWSLMKHQASTFAWQSQKQMDDWIALQHTSLALCPKSG